VEQGTSLDAFSRSATEKIPQIACLVPCSKETDSDTNSARINVIYLTAQYLYNSL
jgi:hypothetical protein